MDHNNQKTSISASERRKPVRLNNGRKTSAWIPSETCLEALKAVAENCGSPGEETFH